MAVPFSASSLPLEIFSHVLSPCPSSRQFSFVFPQMPPQTTTRPLKLQHHRLRALREWREYEEAVKRKDLARALRFLKSVEKNNNSDLVQQIDGSVAGESTPSRLSQLRTLELEKDWQVLDTCLNADDMRLVGSAFRFLKERGLLPHFGKFSNIGGGPKFSQMDALLIL